MEAEADVSWRMETKKQTIKGNKIKPFLAQGDGLSDKKAKIMRLMTQVLVSGSKSQIQ